MLANSITWVTSFTSSQIIPLLATATESDSTAIMAGVLISLIVIYLASIIGAEICARLNMPPVLGQLLGGLVVGISAFHLLVFPEGGGDSSNSLIINFLIATTGLSLDGAVTTFQINSEVISVLAEIGVVILLFEIGLESDLKELLKVGPYSAIVALVGVAAPFFGGTFGLIYLFGVPTIPAIFAGAALTATSIGITAKVLAELQYLNRKEGQIIIGAAVLDDVLGIIILAVVASLAKTGEVELTNVLYLIVSAVAFLVGAVLLGRLFNPYFVKIVDELRTRGQLLIPALIFAFVLSYIATAIHLEAILGAFTAGLVLAETQKCRALKNQVVPIADILVPIFFVVVSAKTNIGVLNPFVPENREGLIIAAFLILVAIVGKVISGFTVFDREETNRLAIGVGMIPRGEVGLVFAGIGSTTGVLSGSLDAAIIVMVILTTFLAPPLLSFVFQKPAQVSVETKKG
ncbi:cation:proton antiporter [Chlorogloeopsis fritschii PCC 9212]|uniref:Sodium:proton antiporter n=1 Tax=Chlorogloeopsis fritschii PCC 6912 TaxID=211165 RepID=A0A3S1AA89_CHLFR|nr:cation:proton antiporter [Chlorogloeopsis fritschii]RUR73768.1 sodium:proton antiporter [Chlorogloeopsis fritschii PCC 6912]